MSDKNKTKEKRNVHRLDIALPVAIKTFDTEEFIASGTTLNISATGMCLLTPQELDIRDRVLIRIGLPGEEDIHIHAEVVWTEETKRPGEKGYEVGLKILEPLQSGEARFVQFFASQFLTSFATVKLSKFK